MENMEILGHVLAIAVSTTCSVLCCWGEREREIHLCTDDFGDKKGQLQVKERYFEIFVEDDGRFS